MSQRIKNHHFVPKVLQKRFATDKDRIWYSARNRDGFFESSQIKRIEKAFCIRDLYTVLDGAERSDIIEREVYGKIDDYLGRLLPGILEAIERREVPTFSGEPLNSIRRVVFEMMKRTPDFSRRLDDTEIGKELIESRLTDLSDLPNSEERSRLISDLENQSQLRQYGRSVRVRATIGRMEKVEENLKEFSVRWAVSESRSSFVLSSLMVYRIGNGGPNGFSNPNMEIWMPIAPKAALVLVRDQDNRIPYRVVEGLEHIRQINEYALRNCGQIASHSQKLIESLTGKRAKLE